MRGEENVRAECYAKTATWLAEQQVGAVPLIETGPSVSIRGTAPTYCSASHVAVLA